MRDRLRGLAFGGGALWIALAAVIAMFAWASTRGFDITDEGSYYLESWQPRDSDNSHTLYHWFSHAALLMTGSRLWLYRLLTVALHLASTLFLLGGVRRWMIHHNIELGALRLWTPVVMVTSLAGFSFVPVALTYNTLNGISVSLWLGAWLAFRAGETDAGRRWRWLAMVWLFCIGSLLIKASTGAFLAGISLAGTLSMACRGDAMKRRFPWFMAGTALVFLAAICLLRPATEADVTPWYHAAPGRSVAARFLQTVLAYLGTYGFSVTCRRLFVESGLLLASTLPLLLPPITLGLVGRLHQRSRNGEERTELLAAFWFGAAVTTWMAVAVHQSLNVASKGDPGHYFSGSGALTPILLSSLILSALPLWWSAPRGWCGHCGFDVFIMLLTPILGWFGSGNPIEFNTLFQVGPWIVLTMLACTHLSTRAAFLPRILPPLLLMTLVTFYLHQGVMQQPYRAFTPLTKQNKAITIGPHREQRLVDPQLGRYLNATKSLLKSAGFRTGDSILAFYNMPGVVFAVGGRSPGHSWFFGHGTHPATNIDSAEIDRMRLASVPADTLRKSFVIQEDGGDAFVGVLRDAGVRFPEDFERVGEVERPDFAGWGKKMTTIWKPRSP